MKREALTQYLHQYLQVACIQDYCPNGLQVEGKAEVERVITGVTASRDLIEAALDKKADALLVHHGYFWKGEAPEVVGMKRHRLKLLIENDINLYAYHLPLDVHPEIGNNAELGRVLGLEIIESVEVDRVPNLIWLGEIKEPSTLQAFRGKVAKALGREPLCLGDADKQIKRIAWCTGAAHRFIDEAKRLGADLYLSGEVSEQTPHFVRENDIAFLGCGHHATERYGIKALGEHLAKTQSLRVEFIDIDNPV